MTYTVIARCARTGRFGIGSASYTMAIGAYCNGAVRPGVGATVTQGAPLIRNNRLAIALLAQGYSPQPALAALEQNDPHYEYRQIAILDRDGGAAVHTGSRVRPACGQRVGAGFVAIGCMLASDSVLDALTSRFEAQAEADLEDRLLAALEAGRDAGGLQGSNGTLPERSVALIVWGSNDYSDIDLRVDLQEGAIAALRGMYGDYKPTAEYYEERARHPREAIPAMEFADMLKRKQEQSS